MKGTAVSSPSEASKSSETATMPSPTLVGQ